MAMFAELEGGGECGLPVTGSRRPLAGVVWTDEEEFRVGEHLVVLSHAKGLLKAVVTPPPPTDFKFEAEFDNEQLDAAKFGPMPFEARVKVIECALNGVMSLSATLAVDDDILKLGIHVPVAGFSVTYMLPLARVQFTESDLLKAELRVVKKQLADARIVAEKAETCKSEAVKVAEKLKEQNSELKHATTELLSEVASLKRALTESELKQAEVEFSPTAATEPFSERMLGCPHFLKAIEEGYFDKFVHFYASRRELPADATFECFFGDDNAMHWAAKYGRADVLKYLIEDGTIDVNRESKYGSTALIHAAYYGHNEAVRLLLAVDGVHVNKQQVQDYTALIEAATRGHLECVKSLVEMGKAKLSIIAKGKTALEWAQEKGHSAIARYLRSKAARM